VVVTAVLIRAKAHYGDGIRIHSDGSWDDWSGGRALVRMVFGDEADVNPLEEN
jgi:hypothetical protein